MRNNLSTILILVSLDLKIYEAHCFTEENSKYLKEFQDSDVVNYITIESSPVNSDLFSVKLFFYTD